NYLLSSQKNKTINFWSAYDRIIEEQPYTTNSCEAYHRHLNTKIKMKDQPIGKIIDVLKKETHKTQFIINYLKFGKILIKRKSTQLKNILINYFHYTEYEFYECLEKILNINIYDLN
ncbi:hypothetical protein DMUE_5840, partial [Dictyocoela muelleri]